MKGAAGKRDFEGVLLDAHELAGAVLRLLRAEAGTPEEQLQVVEALIQTRVRLNELVDEAKWILGPDAEKELRARRRGCAGAQTHRDGRARSRSTPGTGVNDTPQETIDALVAAVAAGEPVRLAAKRLGIIFSAAREWLHQDWMRRHEEAPEPPEPLAPVIQLFPRSNP